jgi:hypothetical protein
VVLAVREWRSGCLEVVLTGKSCTFRREEAILLTRDRVNMYASTWICTKEIGIDMNGAKVGSRKASLAEMMLEGPAMRME